jgi:outer membrane receptor for ferrienterochelin and colicins
MELFKVYVLTGLFLLMSNFCLAQNSLSLQIFGEGEPLPFSSIEVSKIEYQGVCDNNGQVYLEGLVEGETYELKARYLGYLPLDTSFIFKSTNASLRFTMDPVPFELSEMVVSGTRTNKRRLESAVAVNVIDSKTFEMTNSGTLAEGMCFQPGLRVETDCQTCNYTQLRMNGLAGSYTQVLIDSRPIFSSIMSLYSLEQIPATQIEQVEVVRGGGSVLYGANAIAGTVNVITKLPSKSEWSVKQSFSRINSQSNDLAFQLNGTIVDDSQMKGISFYASDRNRMDYDHNGDGFSELPQLKTTSFGTKFFWKANEEHVFEGNLWKIHSFRRGGNAFDLPADQADQSEERDHNILAGGLEYKFMPKGKSYWANTYLSFQDTDRRHYTGVDQSDGWGNTVSNTIVAGAQFNNKWNTKFGDQILTTGYEYQYDYTFDEIKAYNFLIDQQINLSGIYVQGDFSLGRKWSLISGVRYNNHTNLEQAVLTPRVNLLFKPNDLNQIRASWAKGFKPAQAFETDMHIAFSGGGISRIEIAEDLKEETSKSYNLSWDFNKANYKTIYGFTMSAFYTTLYDAFILEEKGVDNLGNQVLLRRNGGLSTVQGLNLETRWNYDQIFQLEAGMTFQSSKFDEVVSWSETLPGNDLFLRTPDEYGFFTLSLWPQSKLNGVVSGVYTGSMLVPHFGGAPEQIEDELYVSDPFWEINMKLDYKLHHAASKTDLKFSFGVQNLFNAYQDNFDSGKYRDSNFVYGPSRPRSLVLSLVLSSSK